MTTAFSKDASSQIGYHVQETGIRITHGNVFFPQAMNLKPYLYVGPHCQDHLVTTIVSLGHSYGFFCLFPPPQRTLIMFKDFTSWVKDSVY